MQNRSSPLAMTPANAQVSAELASIADPARVLVRRSGVPNNDGKCVVYWMQRAMRIADNPALDVAVEVANLLGLPVVVYFQVIPNYPNANLRHYHFLQQGLRDVAADAAERGVGFVVRRTPAKLEEFLEEVQAAILIGDENPCREPERWRNVLAGRLKIPFWTVDADVVVPSRVFGRSFVLLHHFRPKLKAELPKFLVRPANPKAARSHGSRARRSESFSLSDDITDGFQQARPFYWAGGLIHRRNACGAEEAAGNSSSTTWPNTTRNATIRRRAGPAGFAVFALWQYRPVDHCTGCAGCDAQG